MNYTIEKIEKRKSKHLKKKKGMTLKKADILFSNQIRNRDKKCQFPGCTISDFPKLQNSHYFGRAVKSTRFNPDNCITLCWLHHFKDKLLGFEYQKQTKEKHGFDGQYTIFMRNRLGEKRFKELNERAKLSIRQDVAISQYASTVKN